MNTKILKSIIMSMCLICSLPLFAKAAAVKISSPADGAKLMSAANNKIVFDVDPGPKGDHVHLYVDDNDPIVLNQLKGEYKFKKLEAGNRNICVKLVDKNHTPVGAEKCIKVNVE